MTHRILHHSRVGKCHHYALFSPADAHNPVLQVLSLEPLSRTDDYKGTIKNEYNQPASPTVITVDILICKILISFSALLPWILLALIPFSPSLLIAACIFLLVPIAFLTVKSIKHDWIPILEEIYMDRNNKRLGLSQSQTQDSNEENRKVYEEIRGCLKKEAEHESAVILPPKFPPHYSMSTAGIKHDILLYNTTEGTPEKTMIEERISWTVQLLAKRTELKELLSLKRTTSYDQETTQRIDQLIIATREECSVLEQNITELTLPSPATSSEYSHHLG